MANEKINEYVTARTAVNADDGDLFDIDALISAGPNVYDSQSISLAVLKSLFKARAKTETAILGVNAITFTNPFPTGTTVIVTVRDNHGIGLGAVTLITEAGFSIEAGMAGDFSYIAAAEY